MGLEKMDVVRPPAAAGSESAPESVPSLSRQDDVPRSPGAQMSLVERIWDALSLAGVLVMYVVSHRSVSSARGRGDAVAAG
jgi:hypothetical protein